MHWEGIRVIYDLRSAPEIKRDGPEWAGIIEDATDPFKPYGIKREWVPVFAEADYGPEQVALRYKEYTRSGPEGFVKAYSDILLAGKESYRTIFQHLAQKAPSPCVVHCTAGKDRTGVLVALLFMLAGAPAEVIAKEYSLTDLGLASLKPLFIERLLKNPALAGNRDGVENMVSSREENMMATVTMIEKDYGSAQRYMMEHCGLTESEVKQLKQNLTENT